MLLCMPWHTCGGWRATCWSWFSPSTTWSWGLDSGLHAWQQRLPSLLCCIVLSPLKHFITFYQLCKLCVVTFLPLHTCQGQRTSFRSQFFCSTIVGPGDWTQVTRLGGKCPYPLSHPAGPVSICCSHWVSLALLWICCLHCAPFNISFGFPLGASIRNHSSYSTYFVNSCLGPRQLLCFLRLLLWQYVGFGNQSKYSTD